MEKVQKNFVNFVHKIMFIGRDKQKLHALVARFTVTVINYLVGNSDIGLYNWFSALFEQTQTGSHIPFNSATLS
jgi:hypothetical protein